MSDIRINMKVDGLMGIVSKLAANHDTKIKIVEKWAELIDPWVPYKTGELAHSYRVDETGITYTMPYADERYNIPAMHYTTAHHPLASYRWDEAAIESGQKEILNEYAKQAIIEQFKGYFS